jgi:magnesium-transporting ATPase (P-type)
MSSSDVRWYRRSKEASLERLALLAKSVSHDAARGGDGDLVGDPTEVALLRAAGRNQGRDRAQWPRCDELPFDSIHKCMRHCIKMPP